MNQAAVEFVDVSKAYGALRAVAGVTLSVPPGQRLALLGHNGAGKTTLMKLILGLTHASAGAIRLFGVEVDAHNIARQRRQVGFLPENVSFYGGMSARQVLRFYARLKGEPAARCDFILEQVGLSDALRKPVRTYSKGMRQRLGLAQALLGAPNLLLLDEPTSGLDPALRRHFFDVVTELAAGGCAVMLSSHVLTELETRTDRAVVMKNGRVIADGSLAALRRDANLPVRIRLAVPQGQAAAIAERVDAAHPTLVNDHAVHLSCASVDKVSVVRRILDLGVAIDDLDITPPTLDDIYAYYRDRETST